MGIDTGEIEYGNDCGCFPPGETPKFLFASFIGIKQCPGPFPPGLPGPPNGVYSMQQGVGTPCEWYGVHGKIAVSYLVNIGADKSWLIANATADVPGLWDYFGDMKAKCIRYFENMLVPGGCWGTQVGHDGIGYVSFVQNPPVPGIKTIMDLINMEAKTGTNADFYPIDATNTLYKFARTKDATNILIKYEE